MKIKHCSCHKQRRAAEYPDVAEQLDALWHAMDEGLIPKVEPMYSSIREVKDRYPKPTTAE